MGDRNLTLRLFFLALFSIPIIFHQEFLRHIYIYLTGSVVNYVIRREWHIAALSILLFLAFLAPLSYRRRVKWTEYGLATAFFASLFIEMYGIPLTILLSSKFFSDPQADLPSSIVYFDFLGVGFGMDLGMTYGAVLMVAGAILILLGWATLYSNVKKTPLVTTGIYSYSRHPQYLGFMLIIFGWLVAWPTILTVVMAPIMLYKYARLCGLEEKEASGHGDYKAYRDKVPMLI